MRILIAYDGKESGDIGINELRRAGLPIEAETIVLSVAELRVPPPPKNEMLENAFPLRYGAGAKSLRKHAAQKLKEADQTAKRGGERLRQLFPGWNVIADAAGGKPAEEILKYAAEWQPDLIVVGSHNHTKLGKILLGSVSQKVLAEAKTSVRVARRTVGSGTSAQRIVLAYDGSDGAEAAARAVAKRAWAPGSEIRVAIANEPLKAHPIARIIPPVGEYVKEFNEDIAVEMQKIATGAVEELRRVFGDESIMVSSSVLTGDDAAELLVRHASEFGADSIFTGANRFANRFERIMLGSVSAKVAERAACSVEVIRAARFSSL